MKNDELWQPAVSQWGRKPRTNLRWQSVLVKKAPLSHQIVCDFHPNLSLNYWWTQSMTVQVSSFALTLFLSQILSKHALKSDTNERRKPHSQVCHLFGQCGRSGALKAANFHFVLTRPSSSQQIGVPVDYNRLASQVSVLYCAHRCQYLFGTFKNRVFKILQHRDIA